jgi:hypothetical protein
MSFLPDPLQPPVDQVFEERKNSMIISPDAGVIRKTNACNPIQHKVAGINNSFNSAIILCSGPA